MVSKNKLNSKVQTDMDAIVKDLMGAGELSGECSLPDNFDDLDPVEFARSVARHKEKNNKDSIQINAWGDASAANSVINKFEEAYTTLTGEEMELALTALEISLDYGVIGSELWSCKSLGKKTANVMKMMKQISSAIHL